jgi:hypothetical protein
MNEMVERVARAICVADGVDPDMLCSGLGNIIPEGETWTAWRVREKQARAAIAAMREPTEAMTSAVLKKLNSDPRWVAMDYRTMIDEALKGSG